MVVAQNTQNGKENKKSSSSANGESASGKSQNSDSSGEKEFEIGASISVKRGDGTWHAANVVHARSASDTKEFEYYVHYDGLNRRLDEWVRSDRIKRQEDSNGHQNVNDSDILGGADDRKITRNQKRKHDEINHVQKTFEEMDPTTRQLEKEHEALTKVKYIDRVQFGRYEIDTWYFSPFPNEYGKQSKLWICEYCLKYMRLEKTYR